MASIIPNDRIGDIVNEGFVLSEKIQNLLPLAKNSDSGKVSKVVQRNVKFFTYLPCQGYSPERLWRGGTLTLLSLGSGKRRCLSRNVA